MKVVLAAAALAALFVAAPALATPGDDAPQLAGDRAVSLAEAGMREFEQGHWDQAFQRFQEANIVVPSPVFQLYMGRARKSQGRLLDARKIFEGIASAPVPSDAPPAFAKAQSDAKAELADLAQAMPSLVLTVTGAQGDVRASVDGAAVAIAQPIELDPGEHDVSGAAADGRVVRKKVTLRAGQKSEPVQLDFDAASSTGSGPLVAPSPDTGGSALGPVGWVLAGTGAASLIAGAVTGGMALGLNGDINDLCAPVCSGDPATITDDYDRMNTLANVSTATLIIGGVLAATGVTLVIVDATSDDDGPTKPVASLSIGPLGATLDVAF